MEAKSENPRSLSERQRILLGDACNRMAGTTAEMVNFIFVVDCEADFTQRKPR